MMSAGRLVFWIIPLFLALLFFLPFFFKIDSERKFWSVRWGPIVLAVDLSRRITTVAFAGIQYRKEKKGAAPSPPKPEAGRAKQPGWRSFLPLLLARPFLAIDLARKSTRYAIGLVRAFSVSELYIDFSFEDPVINGVCYGAVQGIRIQKVHLAVNFWGKNRLIGQFWLPLYRIVAPTVLFLIQLPYLEIYRVIQESRRRRPA